MYFLLNKLPVGDSGSAEGITLGAVLGAGRPTGSIFQLITGPVRAAGATGQQPADRPGTLEKSVVAPSVCPLEINIIQTQQQ